MVLLAESCFINVADHLGKKNKPGSCGVLVYRFDCIYIRGL